MNDFLGLAKIAEQLGKLLKNLVGIEQHRLAERKKAARAIIEACVATRLLTQALENGNESSNDGKINVHTVSDLWGEAADLIAPFSPETYEELWVKAYAWRTGQWDHDAFENSPVPRKVEEIMAEALKIVPAYQANRFTMD